MKLNRRQTLSAALSAGIISTLPRALNSAVAADEPTPPKFTGPAVKGLSALDDWIVAFMAKHSIPGGQLAVAYKGKIVYSRGCGLADKGLNIPVEPNHLFRIASISKPITAVAILRLVQQGKLKLDDRVDDILRIEPHLETGAKPDERWQEITIAQLLSHTGGWDRDASYDPMFAYERISKSLSAKLPVGTAEIIRYMRGQPLDNAPGKKYAYSNFGYCLLGRVIEKLAKQDYVPFVQSEVFTPLGITAPRMGRSLDEDRAKLEVRYYTVGDEKVTPMVGPHAGDAKHPVPLAYGGWHQEALDAHGGWICSAENLVQFAAAFDDAALNSSKPLLKKELVEQMFAKHAALNKTADYGLGWILFTPSGYDRPSQSHGGALPCTASVLIKLRGELNLAVLFNFGQNKKGEFIGRGLDAELAKVALNIEKWPE